MHWVPLRRLVSFDDVWAVLTCDPLATSSLPTYMAWFVAVHQVAATGLAVGTPVGGAKCSSIYGQLDDVRITQLASMHDSTRTPWTVETATLNLHISRIFISGWMAAECMVFSRMAEA